MHYSALMRPLARRSNAALELLASGSGAARSHGWSRAEAGLALRPVRPVSSRASNRATETSSLNPVGRSRPTLSTRRRTSCCAPRLASGDRAHGAPRGGKKHDRAAVGRHFCASPSSRWTRSSNDIGRNCRSIKSSSSKASGTTGASSAKRSPRSSRAPSASVVATGGGVVNEPRPWKTLRRADDRRRLRARPEDHWRRVTHRGPAPDGDNPDAMAELRRCWRAARPDTPQAHIVVDTTRKTPQAVAKTIAGELSARTRGKGC